MESTIARLKGQIEELEGRLSGVIKTMYPIGCRVEYIIQHRQGAHGIEAVSIEAQVVRHGYGRDIFIQNLATGKTRRVDGSSEYLEAQ